LIDGGGGTPPRIALTAFYPGPAAQHPEGWTFSGALVPGVPINLTTMVGRFLGVSPVPGWVPVLTIDRLAFSVNSGTPRAGPFAGSASLGWQAEIFGTPMKVRAGVDLDLAKGPGDEKAHGRVTGAFSINRIALTAGLDLGVPKPTYLFRVQFDTMWIQAV